MRHEPIGESGAVMAGTDNGDDVRTETAEADKARRGGTDGKRVLVIVQNLPVPFDRRVWLECQALMAAGYEVSVVCPKGKGDPSYEVIDGVRLYKYRPYAPGGSKFSFVTEYVYSFLAPPPG